MGDLTAFDKTIVETAQLLPRGYVTSYSDMAEAAGSTDFNMIIRVGWLVRKRAPKHSHRILKKHGRRALAVARGYCVAEGGFSYAIRRLRDEGIDVSESGIVEKTMRYMDADALKHLRPRAAAQHSDQMS